MRKKGFTLLMLLGLLLASLPASAHGLRSYASLYFGYSGYSYPFAFTPFYRSYYYYFPRESNPNPALMETIRALGEERRAMWVAAKNRQAAELKAATPSPPTDLLVAPEIKTEQKKEMY